jgi:hypothetical protein
MCGENRVIQGMTNNTGGLNEMIKKWLVLLSAILIFVCPAESEAFENYQAANVVLGQQDMEKWAENAGGLSAKSLKCPQAVFTDKKRFYIVDKDNNRVLISYSVPTTDFSSADIVVGQPDMDSNKANNGGLGANTLKTPESAWSDGTRLFIADGHNHRVLIYNTIPTGNNVAADVVIGQPDMQSNEANQGGDVKANTLYFPRSIYSDGTKLFIADYWNHRVLIYNTIPTSNNAAADVVVGQSDVTGNEENQGGSTKANTLRYPNFVYCDGTKLLISDELNHRVLVYNTVPTSHDASADVVIGQPNMQSNKYNQTNTLQAESNSLHYPYSVYKDDFGVYIADLHNNRILVYDSIPDVNNASADAVIGQPNMRSYSFGGPPTARTLNKPVYVYSDNNRLYIADYFNHRVLIYNTKIYIESVSSNYALAGQAVKVDITGTDVENISSVKLINGNIEINALDVNVENPRKISCTFDLNTYPMAFNMQFTSYSHKLLLSKWFYALEQMTGLSQWEIRDLGQVGNPVEASYFSIGLNDSNEDGSQEVYVANGEQNIFECSYNGAWSIEPLQEVADYVTKVVVCDGDHDQTKELYGITLNERKFIQFDGYQWHRKDLDSVEKEVCDLASGDGNNDGKPEIYAASTDHKIYQFVFSQGDWHKSDLGEGGAGEMLAVTTGDGDGDDEYEVYAANKDRHIYQFKYNGLSWTKRTIATVNHGEMNALVVGDGDNDGTNEVYGANADGGIYQFKWNGSGWKKNTVNVKKQALFDLAVSDADNDGVMEIYTCSQDGHIYQYNASTDKEWLEKDLGYAGVSLRALAIGDSDNNNRFEIFTLGENNHLYQFENTAATPTPTPVVTPVPDKQIRAINSRINPVNGEYTTIRWFQAESCHASIKLYNLHGELVKTLVDNKYYTKGQLHEVIWRGLNNAESIVASGIYIVYIQAGDYKDRIKVAVIK